MRIRDVGLADLLTLTACGDDEFEGIGVRYPWGPRLYGGQVVAQALRAAAHTVGAHRPPHSLHAYFIRPGTHTEPIVFRVQRLRDGRSFSTREVTACQSAGAILSATMSFHAPEPEADVGAEGPGRSVPDPEDVSLVDDGWGNLLERRSPVAADGPSGHWIRLNAELPGDMAADPVMRACGLAFMSDAAPSRAARSLHPELHGDRRDQGNFSGASLDHSLWFHRIGAIDEWHWFDMRSHGLFGGRGVVTGDVFGVDGLHRATVAQQVLLRAGGRR